MGLSRDIREINRQMLTDKQQRQIDRQERQQLKDLQLLENAQKQHLQLFLRQQFQYYLDLNYNKFKNDLYLISFKNALKDVFLTKNKDYIDIVFIYFDDFYYKELAKQLKFYEKNQKALPSNTPIIASSKKSPSLLKIIFLFFFHFFNILNVCMAGFNTKKRRF